MLSGHVPDMFRTFSGHFPNIFLIFSGPFPVMFRTFSRYFPYIFTTILDMFHIIFSGYVPDMFQTFSENFLLNSKGKGDGKCYDCGEPGHIARNCAATKQENGGNVADLFALRYMGENGKGK